MPADTALMEKLTALCKRRGFIYPGSEIYGGLGGFWDYGPLGVELKRHIKDLWWRDMVLNPPTGPDGKELTMVGIDAALIMNPKVWEASGHVGGFSDPMVDCRVCKRRYRADQILLVSILPSRAIQNLKEAMSGNVKLELAASASKRTCVALELELGRGLGSAITEAVQTFAKANNIGFLKKFVTGREGKPGKYVLVAGFESGPASGFGNHDFECVVERSQGATLNAGRRPCPACQNPDSLTEPRQFNLMFKTKVGALEDDSATAYLRPETAQGIFVNYRNVLDTSRIKLPFGIAQIGKAFRNEINPRNYTFRSREFEQMEIEFFCRGATERRSDGATKGETSDMEWYEFWRKVRYDWYVNLGLKSEKLRLRDQTEDELAHYSKCCADIEYLFPFSDEFQELEGVAHRGCYDLEQHQKFSGRDMTYFDDDLWQEDAHKHKGDKDAAKQAKQGPPYRFLPTVIEPSAGVDRTALAFLCEAYTEDEAPNDKGQMEKRVVMRLHPKLAPIKAAFFPLVNKAGMPEIAESLYRDAKKHMYAFHDEKGAIGRRYRRQDEAGTPFCITVDGQTLEDGTVTIRDRDTLAQIRVHQDKVVDWLREHLL